MAVKIVEADKDLKIRLLGELSFVPGFHSKDLASFTEFLRHSIFFVALDGEKIVGFAILDKKEQELGLIEVLPEYRGKKGLIEGKFLANALVEAVEEKAKQLGFKKIFLIPHSMELKQEALIRWYKSLGYKGEYRMEKNLSPKKPKLKLPKI